jgi:hypothetical protein
MKSATTSSHQREQFYQSRTGRSMTFLVQLLVLLCWLQQPSFVTSTLVLPEYNRSFTSMPAMFGDQLNTDGTPVQAHMMIFKDLPLLCQEDVDEYNLHHTNSRTNKTMEITITPPDDGLPVALLVQRGGCTFYEKAVVASQWKEIRYLVVYDNEMNADLVPMSSEYPVNLTLLFVSYNSGHGKIWFGWGFTFNFLKCISAKHVMSRTFSSFDLSFVIASFLCTLRYTSF